MTRTTPLGILVCIVPLLLSVQLAETLASTKFQVKVNLAQVDAVVSDAKGHPARGLEAADFQVFEEGRPEVITNFSYVAVTPFPSGPRQNQVQSLPFPPKLFEEEVRRVLVLMFDDAGTDSWYGPETRSV